MRFLRNYREHCSPVYFVNGLLCLKEDHNIWKWGRGTWLSVHAGMSVLFRPDGAPRSLAIAFSQSNGGLLFSCLTFQPWIWGYISLEISRPLDHIREKLWPQNIKQHISVLDCLINHNTNTHAQSLYWMLHYAKTTGFVYDTVSQCYCRNTLYSAAVMYCCWSTLMLAHWLATKNHFWIFFYRQMNYHIYSLITLKCSWYTFCPSGKS